VKIRKAPRQKCRRLGWTVEVRTSTYLRAKDIGQKLDKTQSVSFEQKVLSK